MLDKIIAAIVGIILTMWIIGITEISAATVMVGVWCFFWMSVFYKLLFDIIFYGEVKQ